MGERFALVDEPPPAPDVVMRLLVDSASRRVPPWPQPYFRGLSHLVFAGFDSESELLIDLRTQRIIGRLSSLMAADRAYLQRVVFPAIFGIVSETIRLTPLHCACVARKAKALLLAGDSGSGKSTLSLALAQSGLDFISDDWTYLSRRGGTVLAWSLSNSIKLLPDAVAHFPQLAGIEPTTSLNGELAYELEPGHEFGIQSCPWAEPASMIFLRRQGNQEFKLTQMSSAEAATRLEQNLEELPATVWGEKAFLVETIRSVAQLPCWELLYGAETPQLIAQNILRFFNGSSNV